MVEKGVYGKLPTISAPNCPKIFTAFLTGVAPEQNGITGFVVGGQTASTHRLKSEPIWSAKTNYQNSIAYDHSSLLKAVQEIFGVTPLLGGAADPATHDLSDFFLP